MKKQISLLLVAVALNLSNGAQASFYSPLRQGVKRTTPLFTQLGTRSGGLSRESLQAIRNYSKQPIQQLTTPGMRTFAPKVPQPISMPAARTFAETPQSNYSSWQKLIAAMFAGGALAGAGYVSAEEENQPKQVGWFERWFGKPSGYSHGKLQEKLWEIMNDKNEKILYGGRHILPKIQNLIDQGLDIAHAKDEYGQPVLRHFIITGNIELVKFTLEHGANPNEKNSYGQPILYDALQSYNNPESLKLLLEHGADVNVKDNKGTPILFYAIQLASKENLSDSKSHENLKALLKHGAYINATTKEGLTALEYAKTLYPDIVPILKEYGKVGDTELSPTVKYISEWYRSKE